LHAAAGLFALPEADPRQLAMLGIIADGGSAAERVHRPQARRLGRAECRQLGGRPVTHRIAKARGLKTVNFVRRPELVPKLQAVGGDLVIVDQSGAIDKIRATIGDARVPLALMGSPAKPAQP